MRSWTPVKRSTARSDDPGTTEPVAYALVVVGTSWGGLAALRTLVGGLPPGFDIPIAIVQHRHRNSDTLLTSLLQDETCLDVREIEDKQPIESGYIFVAPPDYHALVEHGHFSLSLDAPVRYSRPSIDVTMTSAAVAYTHRTVGVVLTGANADGAEGLRRIVASGGLAVVQDPVSAEMPAMPEAALRAVPTARVFPVGRIATFLGALPSSHPRSGNGA